jgi:hypothetical protein
VSKHPADAWSEAHSGIPTGGSPDRYAGNVPLSGEGEAGYDEANDGTPFGDREIGPGGQGKGS